VAIVRQLKLREFERYSPQTEVDGTYALIEEPDGTKSLQIDTYGSPHRKITGKVSQSIRFSRSALEQLAKIIEDHFGEE
jgi:hypothetical protein